MRLPSLEIRIVDTTREMREIRDGFCKSLKIGFVPTMGYLHEGHLSLVEASNRDCDITIVSIFVNPTQFGPGEDLETYPRDLERDISLLSQYKVDYLFFPPAHEMYPAGYCTSVTVAGLSEILCGASRPGHFSGVATVVLKLVNITRPHLMFMGSKDFQQVVVLQTMLRDLNLGTEIVSCPIVREPDGLAMSSRNTYLSPEQRQQALCLSQAIRIISDMYREGARSTREMLAKAEHHIHQSGGRIDYLTIADPRSLSPVVTADEDSRILMAVYIGKTRLIDNSAIKA